MNENEFYRLDFKPLSPLITPLQSDTIFGHVAWAVKYLWGEGRLNDLLDAYKDGNDAPFLISDGFPKDRLPKPFVASIHIKRINELINQVAREKDVEFNQANFTKVLKRIKKQHFIKIDTFKKFQQDFSSETVLLESLRELDKNEFTKEKVSTSKMSYQSIVTHNTINRLLGTVTEGLYQQTESFFPENHSFQVYLRSTLYTEAELKTIFEMIEYMGFGRDKSTGKGRFSIKIENGNFLPTTPNANAFMVLSHYVPDAKAPTKGWYRLITKYGRLGGSFACNVIPGIEDYYNGRKPRVHPYKKPLLMIQPGSVFWGLPQFNYGLLLGGKHREPDLWIHKYPRIRHYAYAYPVGLCTKMKEFN